MTSESSSKTGRAFWSFVPWSIGDVLIFAALWIGLQVAGYGFLYNFAHYWPGVVAFVDSASAGNTTAAFVLQAIDALLGFVLVWFFLQKYNVSWSTLGWRRVSILKTLKYVGILFLIFFALITVVISLVAVLVPGFDANQPQTSDYDGATTAQARSLAFLALVILPPVLEETVFRGFLFSAVAKKWGTVGGAIVSSLLFALAHGQANVGVYTFILGLILCFLYRRLGSIVPGIALHMLNNYLAYTAL